MGLLELDALDTLAAIDRSPQTAASKLAPKLGRELQPFKTDVRELERLGLTVSFEVGYALTPRGDEALRAPRDAR